MDLVVRASRMPVAGETILGQDPQMIPGGKGANQAAAASRLGGAVSMVGRVGVDAFGPTLIDNLARQGVKTSYIRRDGDAATGTALIIVDHSGENSIVVSPGANGRVAPADVDAAKPLLSRAKLLLLQLEVPLDAVDRAIELAGRYPVRVILNPAAALALDRALLSSVDVLVPNETEASALTGVPVTGSPSQDTLRAAQEAASVMGGWVFRP
jgi:ribokinase